jgi:23S rRNA (cytosine1962-C5)-methyltransferase
MKRRHQPGAPPRSTTGRPPQRGRAAAPGDHFARCLDRALAARAPLLDDPGTNACRLLNGAADGVAGLVIERLADVLVAQLHEGRLQLSDTQARDLCARARRLLHARAVYRKVFARSRSAAPPASAAPRVDTDPWLGSPVPAEYPVFENGIRFLVRPHEGYSVGLFLEHRETRRRVRDLARGRTVLNAFAYTCAFSVAAALGGASRTVSVDLSKRYLEWGKRNFAANALPLDSHTFICSDVFDYFRRAERQGHRFDVVILDPPTFSRTRRPKRTFAITDDLDRLVAGGVGLMNPGGHILLATNHRRTSRKRLEQALIAAAADRGVTIVARPPLPRDFSGDRDYAKALLARIG